MSGATGEHPWEDDPADDFRRPGPVGTAAGRILGGGALLLGVAWLAWRVAATRDGAPAWLFWPVMAAEAVVWFRLAHLYRAAWRHDVSWRAGLVAEPTVDIVVHDPRTTDDDADDLLVTLVACDTVQYPHRTWVVRSAPCRRAEALAAEHGAELHLRPGLGDLADAVEAALEVTTGEHLLVLTAGDVPFPDVLHATLGTTDDATVGAVVPGAVADRGGFHAGLGSLERYGTYEREVAHPRLARTGAGAWEGGPVLVRRQAVGDIGGLTHDDDGGAAVTSARLQRRGWRVQHRPEALVATPGHEGLDQALAARHRLERDRLAALAATPGGWSGGRAAWFDRASASGSAPMALVVWALAVAAIVTGSPVLGGPWAPTLVLGLTTMAAAATARRSLANGRLLPGDHLVATLQLVPLRLAALAPRSRTARIRGWTEFSGRTLALIPASLGVAVAAAVGLGQPVSGWTLLLAAWLGGGAIAALAPLRARAQRRRAARAHVNADAVIDNRVARVVDLSLGGLGVDADWPLPPGARCEIRLLLPNADGELRVVEATGLVRWSEHRGPSEGWRHGIRFDELPAISRDRLVQFCRVVHPYETLRFGTHHRLGKRTRH